MNTQKMVFFIKSLIDGSIIVDNIEPNDIQNALNEALDIQARNGKKSDKPTFVLSHKMVSITKEE